MAVDDGTAELCERRLALVTGASRGIGFELARQLATHGYDLVVAATSARVETTAGELADHGVRVEAVRCDLARPEGVQRLWARATQLGRPPDVLVLNAGRGAGGAFAQIELADDLEVVDLNVRSAVHLAGLAVPGMHAAGSGRVLLTSSIAASMPGPFQATYNASKAFVQSFGLALREELRGSGVTVTLLLPGPTDTDFFARNAMDDTRIAHGRKDDPADVARDAYDALIEGRERVVSASLIAKLQQAGSKLLPDAVKAQLVAQMARPGSGSEGA